MKFTRRAAGCSLLNHIRNDDTVREIKVDSVQKKLAQRKKKWANNISRIEDIRYPEQLLD